MIYAKAPNELFSSVFFSLNSLDLMLTQTGAEQQCVISFSWSTAKGFDLLRFESWGYQGKSGLTNPDLLKYSKTVRWITFEFPFNRRGTEISSIIWT